MPRNPKPNTANSTARRACVSPLSESDADRAEHRTAGVDHEHGEDDEDPTRRREPMTAVVGALQCR